MSVHQQLHFVTIIRKIHCNMKKINTIHVLFYINPYITMFFHIYRVPILNVPKLNLIFHSKISFLEANFHPFYSIMYRVAAMGFNRRVQYIFIIWMFHFSIDILFFCILKQFWIIPRTLKGLKVHFLSKLFIF